MTTPDDTSAFGTVDTADLTFFAPPPGDTTADPGFTAAVQAAHTADDDHLHPKQVLATRTTTGDPLPVPRQTRPLPVPPVTATNPQPVPAATFTAPAPPPAPRRRPTLRSILTVATPAAAAAALYAANTLGALDLTSILTKIGF